MRILTKTIAAVIAFSLLGQNMLFAQQVINTPTPTLTEIQAQAKQDMELLEQRADLYRYIAGGASIGFIFVLGALLLEKTRAEAAEAEAAQLAKENLKLKESNTQLSKITDRIRKQNKTLQDEMNETRHLYFDEMTSRQQAEAKAAKLSAENAKLKTNNTQLSKISGRVYKQNKTLQDEINEIRHMFFQESHQRTQTELYYQKHLRNVSQSKQNMERFYSQQLDEAYSQIKESSLFIERMHQFGP